MDAQTKRAVDSIVSDYRHARDIDRLEPCKVPNKNAVIDIIEKLRKIIFPGYFADIPAQGGVEALSAPVESAMEAMLRQLVLAFQSAGEPAGEAQSRAREVNLAFFSQLPQVRALIQLDLQASYDGDPAATGMAEIILSYPGFYAITVYRLAHVLYTLKVPMLPRSMTEYAHSVTGIDIHPGAAIGRYFFIDHGTGIVIGETTVIGDNVKLYQGVTLGALSTRGGQRLRGKRRHPTIEDNVTIYAGASVLGGDTVIGRDCVIGSNAFITKSIAPCTTVTIKNQELQFKSRAIGCPEGEGMF